MVKQPIKTAKARISVFRRLRRGCRFISVVLVTAVSFLSGCSLAQMPATHQLYRQNPQAEVIRAQQNRARDVAVTVCARVLKMLPEDHVYPPHQRFLLRLDNGTTVLVAHNTSLAPPMPLREGDLVTVHGQFIWNNKGGVIHLTHRATSRRHHPGWIDFKGNRYQ